MFTLRWSKIVWKCRNNLSMVSKCLAASCERWYCLYIAPLYFLLPGIFSFNFFYFWIKSFFTIGRCFDNLYWNSSNGLACESGSPGKGGPARNPLLCRIYSFSQRTRNLIGSKWKNMLIYAKIDTNNGGCIIERRFFEFCIQKNLKATIYGWTLKLFTNLVHEALEILTVVSSLDCCLLAAPLSQLTSVFVFINSSTTNRFFLHDFVANNFVPGENCYKCLCLMNRTCSLWSDSFKHL